MIWIIVLVAVERMAPGGSNNLAILAQFAQFSNHSKNSHGPRKGRTGRGGPKRIQHVSVPICNQTANQL